MFVRFFKTFDVRITRVSNVKWTTNAISDLSNILVIFDIS